MSTVKVVKSRKGLVVNPSSNNPLEGWVMIEQSNHEWKGGRMFTNKRVGFLRNTVEILKGLDLAAEFGKLGVTDVPVLGKGFNEGQLLPGRVCIQDQLKPIIDANPEFGKRIPQTGSTIEIRNAVREACTAAGLAYQQSGLDIYRKVFYSPYPEGHPRFEADVILSPDNMDEVQAIVATVAASLGVKAGAVTA